jgi:chemotaxis signal transduction protein
MTEVRADAVNRARELRCAFDQTFAEVPPVVTQDVVNLLGIRVGGDPFAIRLGEVAGLFADRKIVPLPSPVPELLGVAGFRSGLIPIYSLRGFLGYPPASEIPPRWLILAGSGHLVGLAFDQFEVHLRVRRSELRKIQGGASRAHIRETASLAEGLRAIVSIDSVVETIKERIGLVGTIEEK